MMSHTFRFKLGNWILLIPCAIIAYKVVYKPIGDRVVMMASASPSALDTFSISTISQMGILSPVTIGEESSFYRPDNGALEAKLPEYNPKSPVERPIKKEPVALKKKKANFSPSAISQGVVTPYQALVWTTKWRESYRPGVYDDIGHPAKGFGCRIFTEDERVKYRGEISERKATAFMLEKLEANMDIVNKKVPGLTLNQQRAVASLFYTTKWTSIERSTLWNKYIKRKVFTPAAVKEWEKFAKGYYKNGRYYRNHRLDSTRELEAALWMVDVQPKYQVVINRIGKESQEKWIKDRRILKKRFPSM